MNATPSPYLLEPALQDFEQVFKCVITLHDRKHVFVSPDNMPMFDPTRSSHRKCHPDFCAAVFKHNYCLNHYFNEINSKIDAGLLHGPFFKRCQFGFLEIAVPLFRMNSHICTFYAGIWRRPFNKPLLRKIMRVLPVVANGFLAQAEIIRQAGRSVNSTHSTIEQFLENRFTDPISTDDLARHLSLSVIHTCHLVREIFGKTFSTLLTETRIRHALFLLQDTQLRIGEIAVQSGFRNAEHFSRIFRKTTGRTPSSYRKH